MNTIGIISIIAGVILLLAALGQSAQNKAFKDAKDVTGTIIDKRKRSLKNGTAYELTVTYTVSGIEYSKVIGVSLTEYRSLSEGDTFDLKYRPDKPNKAVNPKVLDSQKARTVLIFGVVMACIGVVLMLPLYGCGKSNDRPPEPDTLIPAAHVGTYGCEYGELIFSGDGKTVTVHFFEDLAEAVGITDGEYQYSFNWYDFGPCRYDVATKLALYREDNIISYSFMVESASENSIILTYYLQEGFEHMEFHLLNTRADNS